MTTNTDNNKKKQGFIVESFPKERFSLFEKSDFYIYDKKFHNDLPLRDLIQPKSFQFNSSNENFCALNLKTMLFRKHQDILTDPKINTNIHKDFIDNSLKLIFPDLEEEHDFSKIKNDIFNIIEEKDETDHVEHKKIGTSFYQRQPLILTSTLGTSKKHISIKSEQKEIINKNELKKNVENSFTISENIKEGYQHPYKKGIYAKNVYDIVPLYQFLDKNFSELIFNTDPQNDTQSENKFLLTKDKLEENYKLFKNEIDDDIKQPHLYSLVRNYNASISKENEIYNRYLIFLNKEDKKANFVPISNKMFLKKVVKIDNHNEIIKDNKIIMIPQNYTKNDIQLKKKIFKDNGFEIIINSEDFEFNLENINRLLNSKEDLDEEIRDEENEIDDLFKESDNENN